MREPVPAGQAHVDALVSTLSALSTELGTIERWGDRLARTLVGGGRLLTVGNGGSAAQAQHLTAELVGRFLHDRPAFSAIALNAETSSLTAICNDYGADEMFARQVRAHGRRGDILVALSTSGRSSNVLAAVDAGRTIGMVTWGLSGPAPNPLGARCHDHVAVAAGATATVQEAHLVLLHLLCAAVDRHVGVDPTEVTIQPVLTVGTSS